MTAAAAEMPPSFDPYWAVDWAARVLDHEPPGREALLAAGDGDMVPVARYVDERFGAAMFVER